MTELFSLPHKESLGITDSLGVGWDKQLTVNRQSHFQLNNL